MTPLRPRARRLLAPLVLVATLAVLPALLAACGPAPGPLADPREIIAKSVESVAAARSFHYLAELDGEIPLPSRGAAEAAPVQLEGTTIEGEVDVAGARGSALMEIPGLGPAFDAVVVGPDLYIRVGLLGGGYRKTTAADSPLALLSDPAATLAGIDATLDGLPTPPRKEGDRDCGGARCYVVILAVPPGSFVDLPGLFGGLVGGAVGSGLGGLDGLGDLTAGSGFALPSLDPSIAGGGGTAELLVRIDDLRPYSLTVRGTSATAPSMTVTFDRWDAAVTIAPPAGLD